MYYKYVYCSFPLQLLRFYSGYNHIRFFYSEKIRGCHEIFDKPNLTRTEPGQTPVSISIKFNESITWERPNPFRSLRSANGKVKWNTPDLNTYSECWCRYGLRSWWTVASGGKCTDMYLRMNPFEHAIRNPLQYGGNSDCGNACAD